MWNPRVTITLVGSCQVVERKVAITDVGHGYGRPVSGLKRAAGERLGNELMLLSGVQETVEMESPRISQNDLRFKRMHRSLSNQVQGADKRMVLPTKMLNGTQHQVNHHMLQHKSEIKEARGSADDLLLVDSLRNSYFSRSTIRLRSRFPDRSLKTSLGLSPPRNYGEVRKVSSAKAIDTSSAARFPSSGVGSASGSTCSLPTNSIPIIMRAIQKLPSQFQNSYQETTYNKVHLW